MAHEPRRGSRPVRRLLIWIAIEVTVIGYRPDPPLQTIYGALGALVVTLSLAEG